jgi:hypothetical protein
MTDPRPTLRQLARDDRPGAVWCASLCALTVAHRWTDPRPRRTVRLTLAWAVGVPVPRERLRAAAYAADAAAAYAADAAANAAAYAAYAAAAYAADAAAYAANAAANAAAYAANAAAYAAAYAAALAQLAALVDYQVRPVDPRITDHRSARPGALVAWDAAAAELGPVRQGTLGDALRRARVLRLRWTEPVERAVAERLPLDHPALAAIRRK